jgi:hypothetical protein
MCLIVIKGQSVLQEGDLGRGIVKLAEGGSCNFEYWSNPGAFL